MKILNKTDKELKIRITDRYGHMYSVYLPGGRSTELAPYQVSRDVLDFIRLGYLKDISAGDTINHPSNLALNKVDQPVTVECACGIPDIDPEKSASVDESPDADTNADMEDEDDQDITVSDDPDVSGDPSVFKCEVCGSEFASPRGLAMHKSRSHPNESNKEV